MSELKSCEDLLSFDSVDERKDGLMVLYALQNGGTLNLNGLGIFGFFSWEYVGVFNSLVDKGLVRHGGEITKAGRALAKKTEKELELIRSFLPPEDYSSKIRDSKGRTLVMTSKYLTSEHTSVPVNAILLCGDKVRLSWMDSMRHSRRATKRRETVTSRPDKRLRTTEGLAFKKTGPKKSLKWPEPRLEKKNSDARALSCLVKYIRGPVELPLRGIDRGRKNELILVYGSGKNGKVSIEDIEKLFGCDHDRAEKYFQMLLNYGHIEPDGSITEAGKKYPYLVMEEPEISAELPAKVYTGPEISAETTTEVYTGPELFKLSGDGFDDVIYGARLLFDKLPENMVRLLDRYLTGMLTDNTDGSAKRARWLLSLCNTEKNNGMDNIYNRLSELTPDDIPGIEYCLRTEEDMLAAKGLCKPRAVASGTDDNYDKRTWHWLIEYVYTDGSTPELLEGVHFLVGIDDALLYKLLGPRPGKRERHRIERVYSISSGFSNQKGSRQFCSALKKIIRIYDDLHIVDTFLSICHGLSNKNSYRTLDLCNEVRETPNNGAVKDVIGRYRAELVELRNR